MSKNPTFSLSDKYQVREGKIILTGVQALIRIPIDQFYADKAKGLNTATFISGYRGSPVGTIDLIMQQNEKILDKHNIVFQPGVNEELAATAVWGSQTADFYPGAKFDGVKGIWYGKAPGVDRSGDAFKHANFAGVAKHGGVLAFGGDDPISKSSTIPCISELAFFDAMMPVLYPGNIQEIIDYGLLGFELSRYSGLWVGFKCVTDLMDSFGTAEVHPNRNIIVPPIFEYKGKPWEHNPTLFPAGSVEHESIMEHGRIAAAKAFIASNQLNKISVNPTNARIGLIAAGKSYYDLIDGLKLMGMETTDLENFGIRILKLGAIYPIDDGVVNEFAKGLEKIIIVEEKRNLVESQIVNILYHSPYRPVIVGKKNEAGKPLIPAHGETSPDLLADILTSQLTGYIPDELIQKRLAKLESIKQRAPQDLLGRPPYYCSGCPHNTSTIQVPQDAIVGAGIGCHGMVLGMPDGRAKAITHMGGEGAQWVGMAPFSDTPHFIQNIGDGTFAHSGSLSVRNAVNSKANITFKILFNRAVAMTGGQTVEGNLDVPALTRLLEAEGVKKIIVTSNDIDKYAADARWGNNVQRLHRDRILEAQEALRKIEGVTVLIHDQTCAAQLRRMRKKGTAEVPRQRIFINEEVCEGCNDCGIKSNCLSVQPIETEFGRKNTIDQSSCNLDFSCLKGDCPSFLTVIPGKKVVKNTSKNGQSTPDLELDHLPEPKMRVGATANIYMMGIGGTGVVTTNQILGTAARLDDKEVFSLDQIGLSQKGGAVISHFKIVEKGNAGSNRITTGNADAYIGFDVLTAASDKHLKKASPDKTVAVISTEKTPTGSMLRIPGVKFPKINVPISRIEKYTDKTNNIYFNATKISNRLFGSHYHANIMLVGAAYQSGIIPIAANKIEEAIRLNGIKVDHNIMAFRVGRRLVASPELIPLFEKEEKIKKTEIELSKATQQLVSQVGINGSVQKALEIRIPELIAYQNLAYAQEYANFLQEVVKKEQSVKPASSELSETVARYLFKLMAYKDEYEVARLHTKPSAISKLKKQFGENARMAIMLHPPVLRAIGYKKKIKFGAWSFPFFRLLAKAKFLRGTALDIFGYSTVRREERALIGEYKDLISVALDRLTEDNYSKAVELAALPDLIRGYEDIKMDNINTYREKVEEFL